MENYMKIFLLFLFLIQSVGYAEINAIEEEILADNIRNFYKVSDGIYRSAQPDRKNMELMDIIGVKTVINLRRYHSDINEAKNTSLKLERVKMNPGKIKDEDIAEILTLIKNSDKPVLIHCWHGSDRTGVVVAMYRIVFEGFSKEDNGKTEVYKTRERIGKLTTDSLELVTQDGPPRLAFLYLNTKSIKKLVTPEVAPDKKK